MLSQNRLHRLFTHIPVLETQRLKLCRIVPDFAKDMFEYSSDPDVTAFLLWEEHPDEDYTKGYIDYLQERYEIGDYFDWALVEKSTGKMIGTCGFTDLDTLNQNGEVGYVLNPAYRGQGFAPEALRKVLAFGFEKLGLERISGVCMDGNAASKRVMEKCGMVYEGTLRSAVYVKGRRENVCVYAILAKDKRL